MTCMENFLFLPN
uniref:Uncharacterized protein n=1 Tax=Arundo donax TaxID=35708 RepID=A0A0A8ZF02_ARUDO